MSEHFDPSDWLRFDDEDVIFLRRLLQEEMIRLGAADSQTMQCVRLRNLLSFDTPDKEG